MHTTQQMMKSSGVNFFIDDIVSLYHIADLGVCLAPLQKLHK